MSLRAVSLFSGAGGFDLGFEAAGIEVVRQVEIDPTCLSVLARHWPGVRRWDDVTTFEGKPRTAEIVFGGSPCQDLSTAGSRRGLSGERSGLFYEFTRIVGEIRPLCVVWENVPGVLSSDFGRDFARVLRELAKLGYFGAWRVLDSQFFGVAQRRRRLFAVFVVGNSGDERAAKILDIGHCGSRDSSAGKNQASEIASGPESGSRGDSEFVLQCHGTSVGKYGSLRKGRGSISSGVPIVANTILRQYGRQIDSTCSATLIPESTSARRLTPRECERCMGWPDDHTRFRENGTEISDTMRYQMIGNGVVAPVAEWIGKRLVRELLRK